MRMSELASAAGVSAQTIHFYLREGLLPPPVRTAPNMAYYGPEYVEDIRLIKELQEKRYLPLSVIRHILEAKRRGKDVGQLQDMLLSLEATFRPLGPEEEMEPVSAVQLIAMAGLALGDVEALERMGLLAPTGTAEEKRYDGLDVRVARSIKKLLDLGLNSSDLAFYTRYVDALREEKRVVGEKFFSGPGGQPAASGTEIIQALETIKAALAARVYREAVVSHQRET